MILEVGSGNNPNPKSDILVDRYLYDNGQRAGGYRIVVDRPLIVANGYKLPFKDKSFDYVICSHILEHMEQPKEFVKEITRVGKAGYIEVPSSISERMFGWNFHLWYCSLQRSRLILQKKTEGERFGGFFHRLIAANISFRRFFEEYEDIFYVKYEWKNAIQLSVIPTVPSQKNLDSLDKEVSKLLGEYRSNRTEDIFFYFSWMKRRVIKKMRKMVRKFVWKFKKILMQNIATKFSFLFICPKCHSTQLDHKRTLIVCTHCKENYPIDNSIPIFLPEHERKKGY